MILRDLLRLLILGGSGGATQTLRPSIPPEEMLRMLDGTGRWQFRVRVKRPHDAGWTDLTDPATAGEWLLKLQVPIGKPDAPVLAFTVEFALNSDAATLSPSISAAPLNRDAAAVFAPLLYPGNAIEVDCANLAPGETRDDAVWRPWVVGEVEDVDWPSDRVAIACTSMDGVVQESKIEGEQIRGAPYPGVPIAEEIQSLLDDGGLGWTLHVIGAPDFGVGEYKTVDGESRGERIRALARERAWDVRWTWNDVAQEFQYTLFLPPRDKTEPDLTIPREMPIDVPGLKVSRKYVRNRFTTKYPDADTGKRESRTLDNAASQQQFRLRPMTIIEGDKSMVDTAAKADALNAYADNDLSQPPTEKRVKLPFLPYLDLHHLLRFAADGIRYDFDADFAVTGGDHLVDGEQGAGTEAELHGGSPVGMYMGWFRRKGAALPDEASYFGLYDWREQRNADNTAVERLWKRGSAVEWVYVRTALVSEDVTAADGYQQAQQATARELAIGVDSFVEERPKPGFMRYTIYEPRTMDLEVRGKVWKFPLNPLEVEAPSVRVSHVLTTSRSAADLTATVMSPGEVENVRVRMRDAAGVEWLSGFYTSGTVLAPATVFARVDTSAPGTPMEAVALSPNAQTILQFQAEGQDSEAVSGWDTYPLPKIDRPAVIRFHTTAGSDNLHADLYVSPDASYGQGGTLYLWTAKGSTGNADPEAAPDATLAVGSTPATLGPADSPALNEISVWPGRGKVVFARFVATDGGDSGQQSFTLNSWLDLVGADGQLVDDAIDRPAAFAASLRPPIVVSALPATGADSQLVFLTTDRKLYRWTGSEWTRSVDAADITVNKIVAGQIEAGAIGADQVAAHEITAYHLNVASVYVTGLVVTGTSWSACTVDFQGTTYNVAAGSSAQEVVIWTPVSPNVFYGLSSASLEGYGYDQNRGDTIIMILEGGAYRQVWNGTRIYGGHLTTDAIKARHLAAIAVEVGKYIRSTGYVPGVSGWNINGAGDAEFNDVTVRGTVYADEGEFSGSVESGDLTLTNDARWGSPGIFFSWAGHPNRNLYLVDYAGLDTIMQTEDLMAEQLWWYEFGQPPRLVSLGPADSGGTGYRVLRVAN